MKLLREFARHGRGVVCAALLTGPLLTGCRTGEPIALPEPPGRPAATGVPQSIAEAVRFRVGDQVTVTFSGVTEPILPHEERIKEDGTVTLPLIGAVKAAGQTPGELQREIQDLYVPKYYVRLTITVKSQELVFYVGGEVKSPGRQLYVGETTVTKAIQSAGDFTDYANKRKAKLTRADGHIVTVNCIKAQENPKLDLPVFPGDQIQVPRRIW